MAIACLALMLYKWLLTQSRQRCGHGVVGVKARDRPLLCAVQWITHDAAG